MTARDNGAAVNLRAWAAEAEAAAGIARALAPTPFIPEALRRYVDNPDPKAEKVLDLEGTIATVTAVLLAGQELNFGPMASLRSITIIKGTVSLYALAARALLLRAGHEIIVKESTSERAIVDARRAGDTEWQRSIWDLQRARTARLYPGNEYGNWRTNPKAMLVARATAEASRWVAADAMLGLPLIAEEVADAENEAVAEIPEPVPDEAPPKTTAKRRTAPARAALPKAPPLPGPARPDPGVPPPAKPTKPQRDKLFAGLRALKITGRAEGLAAINGWITPRDGGLPPIESTGELSAAETSTALDQIEVLLAARAAEDSGDQADEPDQEGGSAPDAEPDGQ